MLEFASFKAKEVENYGKEALEAHLQFNELNKFTKKIFHYIYYSFYNFYNKSFISYFIKELLFNSQ